jgi:hypothetical protein
LNDPYDLHRVNQTDPFKESVFFGDPVEDFLTNSVSYQARMTSQMRSTLKSMSRRIDTHRPRGVITESDKDDTILEVDFEDVELDRDED